MSGTVPGPRVAIAGAGAIGCVLAARLAAAGCDVSVLARHAALAAIRAGGVRLDDRTGRVVRPVRAGDGSGFGVQDVVFLCSKAHDLPDLAASLGPTIGPDTLIVPLINGVPFWYFHGEGGRFEGRTVRAVDPAGRLALALPLGQVVGAVVYVTAELAAPGHAVSQTPHRLMLGEPQGGLTDRLARLCAVLTGAGIEARPVERIRDPLWTKIAANLATNPLSVVTGATLGALFTRPEFLADLRPVMDEAIRLATLYGAGAGHDADAFVRFGATMGPVRTSMLQDHRRGRPLELAAIGDAVLELADLVGLPMPATSAMLDRVRAITAPCPTRRASNEGDRP